MDIILECLNSKRGEDYGKVRYTKAFDQPLAEKILKRSKNWKLKQGQGFVFKDRVLSPEAASSLSPEAASSSTIKPKSESEKKVISKAD